MALYGAEACGMKSAERMTVNILKMKCLRSLVRVFEKFGHEWIESGMKRCIEELE